MNFNSYLHQQQGFTLIEIMVAMAVLTAALIPLLSVATNSSQVVNNQSTQRAQAVSLARWAMERIKGSVQGVVDEHNVDYFTEDSDDQDSYMQLITELLNGLRGVKDYKVDSGVVEITLKEQPEFTITSQLTADHNGNSKLRRIIVTVAWQQEDTTKQVTLKRLVAVR